MKHCCCLPWDFSLFRFTKLKYNDPPEGYNQFYARQIEPDVIPILIQQSSPKPYDNDVVILDDGFCDPPVLESDEQACNDSATSEEFKQNKAEVLKPVNSFEETIVPYSQMQRESLEPELSEIYEDKPNACELCERRFNTEEELMDHMSSHDPNRPFSCYGCDKSYQTRFALNKHALTHFNEKTFVCDICDSKFKTIHYLRAHKKRHDNEVFTCYICNKGFKLADKLKMHMDDWGGLCDRAKQKGKSLVLPNPNDTLFVCDVCGLKFRTDLDLKRHVQRHILEPFFCYPCKKSFKTADKLKKHTDNGHDMNSSFQCQICLLRFTRADNLRKHSTVHSVERSHLCKFCGNSYKSNIYLKVHIKCIHVNTRKHKCSHCGKLFQRRSDFIKHESLHYRNKYLCQLCLRTFKEQILLENHMVNYHHTHHCYYCFKNFQDRDELIMHQELHQVVNGPNYECNQCAVEFYTEFDFTMHQSIHRPCFVKLERIDPDVLMFYSTKKRDVTDKTLLEKTKISEDLDSDSCIVLEEPSKFVGSSYAQSIQTQTRRESSETLINQERPIDIVHQISNKHSNFFSVPKIIIPSYIPRPPELNSVENIAVPNFLAPVNYPNSANYCIQQPGAQGTSQELLINPSPPLLVLQVFPTEHSNLIKSTLPPRQSESVPQTEEEVTITTSTLISSQRRPSVVVKPRGVRSVPTILRRAKTSTKTQTRPAKIINKCIPLVLLDSDEENSPEEIDPPDMDMDVWEEEDEEIVVLD